MLSNFVVNIPCSIYRTIFCNNTRPFSEKRCRLFPNTLITRNGFGTIYISARNTNFRIPNQNGCGCLSKSCSKRSRPRISKSRPRMPYLFILRCSILSEGKGVIFFIMTEHDQFEILFP